MNYAIAFAAGFLVDLAYTWWVACVGRHRSIGAGLASVAVGVCGLIGIGQALADYGAAGLYLLGLGLGSVLGVELDRRKQ